MDKKTARREFKLIRLAMTRDETAAKSRAVRAKLRAVADWPNIRSICAYRPIKSLNEADIGPLLKDLEREYPALEIAFTDPSRKAALPAEKFDLIIVPCLAFDKDNYRLGWGGGFYDKFLAGQPGALKIGVCFQSGFAGNGLPREPHDIPLDKVITEV